MSEKPAVVLCAKCATPATSGAACGKCGGRLVKVCPECQGQNSLAKNFCDQCGLPLKLKVDASPKPPPEKGQSAPKEAPAKGPEPEGSSFFKAPPKAVPPAPDPIHAKSSGTAPSEPPKPEPARMAEIKIDLKPSGGGGPPLKIDLPPTPQVGGASEEAKKPSDEPSLRPMPSLDAPARKPVDEPRSSEATPPAPMPHTTIIRIDTEKPAPGGASPPAKQPPSSPPASSSPSSPAQQPPRPAQKPPSEPRLQPPAPQKPAPEQPSAHEEPRKHSAHSMRFRNQTDRKPPVAQPPAKTPEPSGPTTLWRQRRSSMASVYIALALLALGASLLVFRWYKRNRPEQVLLRIAARYLEAVQSGDIDAAYDMLSAAARATCPPDEFKLITNTAAWQFSDLKLTQAEDDAAYVSYSYLAQGAQPEQDFLAFVKENGRWVRPYTWNLYNKIEEAFDRNDTTTALRYSQAAVEVQPRDALAHGYLCEAYHAKDSAEEAVKECNMAIALTRKYPSPITSQSIFHLHTILADAFKNALRRYPEAIEEYGAILAFPRIQPPEQCEALLARGDTRVAAADFTAALRDYRSSSQYCTETDAVAHGKRSTEVLDGTATKDAVSLAQAHRQLEGGPTLLEARRQARARKKDGKAPASAGAENWSAEFIGGSKYKVKIESGGVIVMTAEVDLWSNLVQNVKTETQ